MSEKWTTANIPDQRGRVAVVTGANTGLGYETAKALAERGASVVLAVRNVEKGEQAAARMTGDVTVQALDLTSLDSVRTAAAALRSRLDRIDLLINNSRRDVHPEAGHPGRFRDAVRHQPPRPLRAHRAAAGPDAAGARLARGDGQQHRPPHPRRDPLRRPAVGAVVQPGRRLRSVQAGQPDVHIRAAAAGSPRTAPPPRWPRTPAFPAPSSPATPPQPSGFRSPGSRR